MSSTFQNRQCRKNLDYIDLLEYSVPCGLFAFTDDQAVRDEISVHLMKLCNAVVQLYRKTKGRARKELDEKVKKVHVYEGQTKSVSEFYDEIKYMTDKIAEWKRKHKQLEEEKKRFYENLVMALNKQRRVSKELQKSNKELEEYVKTLEDTVGVTSHKGKVVSEATNKTRTLKSFLSRVETALWFSKSFGTALDTLSVKECETGVIHHLKFPGQPQENLSNDGSKYNNLDEDTKTKIEQILFLLDEFCVGDAFYHELSMTIDGLPRSYLVKQCRDDLNKMCCIDPLQGKYTGAKVSSVAAVLEQHIKDYLNDNARSDTANGTIQIKINGDGARMTRTSKFLLLSFSILQSGESVMYAKGNRTIAIVNGSESYDSIKEAFGGICHEINMISLGKLTVNDQEVNVDFFLGGGGGITSLSC